MCSLCANFFSLGFVLFVCFFFCVFFFPPEKVADRSSSNVLEMAEVQIFARKKQVFKCWDGYVNVNVNVMRKVRDRKHHGIEKAAVTFSRGVHSNVLVERTQSNGIRSNAINIALFVLFTSTRYMFYRISTSFGSFSVCFAQEVDYIFSGVRWEIISERNKAYPRCKSLSNSPMT